MIKILNLVKLVYTNNQHANDTNTKIKCNNKSNNKKLFSNNNSVQLIKHKINDCAQTDISGIYSRYNKIIKCLLLMYKCVIRHNFISKNK